MIKVYGNGCPKCKILLSKLDNKNIKYEKEENLDVIIEFAKQNNISSMPITQWDNEVLDYSKAIQKISTI